MDENTFRAHAESFVMNEDESLEGLLADYEKVALRTDELVESAPSLDDSHPLPERPSVRARGSLVGAPEYFCTSSPRRHNMPGMPTSSVNPSTAPRRWDRAGPIMRQISTNQSLMVWTAWTRTA